jgi:hypothetical protein
MIGCWRVQNIHHQVESLKTEPDEVTHVSEALRSVNVGRAVLALPPIPVLSSGHRFASRFSPISLAFEGRLTLLERMVQCDSEELARRLAAAWGVPHGDDGQVELPAAIQTFLHSFEDGMLPEFETNLCTVYGCERTATIVRAGAPMCDQCAEEWETVGPLLTSPNRQAPNTAAQPVRTMTTRLIFALAYFFRSVVSLSRSAAPEPKHTPPKPDKQGPTGSGAAA